MNKKNFEIVVARYNERNIDWINDYKEFVTIYNKGEDNVESIVPLKKSQIIKLRNVGKEAHTYLYHIVSNYFNLSEYTCFIQADPFPHLQITGSTKIFNDMIKNIDEFDDFYWISETTGFVDISSREFSKFVYKQFFGSEITQQKILFAQGAQFAVSKKVIHKRPFLFYKNILDIFEYSSTPLDPSDLYLEFFWGLIFNDL